MPRPQRIAPAGTVLHLVNRGNDRKVLFPTATEYEAFLTLLAETKRQCPLRILAYCLMPNHWHLVVWPAPGQQVVAFFHRLCTTHAVRHRRDTASIGEGHLYQGRYRSFAVESERQYYHVLRYVEGNALRAALVSRAEDWRWSSLPERLGQLRAVLDPGPLALPPDWVAHVNQRLPPEVLADLRERRTRATPVDGRLLPRPVRKKCSEISLVVPDPTP
jgi:putative transposase